MKRFCEIEADKRVLCASRSQDGGSGWVFLNDRRLSNAAAVVWSNGGGWDHVSISYPNRTPDWDEMAKAKEIFFEPEEAAIQIHPVESEYVNLHRHCLHLWRPQKEALPLPPYWMVGPKKGQDPRAFAKDVERAIRDMDGVEKR